MDSIPQETWSFEFCPNDGTKFRLGETRCRICNIWRHQTVVPRNENEVKAQPYVPHELDWERILYVKRKVDDNHVGEDFFGSPTSISGNDKIPSFTTLVISAVYISLHMSLLVIFLAVWTMLRNKALKFEAIVILDVALLFIGYMLNGFMRRFETMLQEEKTPPYASLLIFMLLLWIICPVLKDLTSSYSDDTVWTLCGIFFFIHFLLMDFDGQSKPPLEKGAELLGHGLSVNSAIASCVLLVSRFPSTRTSHEVFATVLLGIIIFAISPGVVREVRATSSSTFLLLSLVIYSASFVSAYYLSRTFLKIWICMVLSVVLLGPLGLRSARKQALLITGPWDLPKIQVYDE